MTKFIDTTEKEKTNRKTEFTCRLDTKDGWTPTNYKPEDFLEVKYLGKCAEDGHMFSALSEEGMIEIFEGIKGFEFD